jgi:hypothetical protein
MLRFFHTVTITILFSILILRAVTTESSRGSFLFSARDLFVHPASIHRTCRNLKTENYVLGLAAGMTPTQLCPFVRSWKLFSPQTVIVIFTDTPTSFFDNISGVHFVQVLSPKLKLTWHNWRFALYENFLHTCGKHIRGVMFSDTRDVVLQSDIWQTPSVLEVVRSQSVLFSLEGDLPEDGFKDILLSNQDVNKEWIRTCFSEQYVNRTLEGFVSCSGTIIGGYAGMYGYAKEFMRVLAEVALPVCGRSPIDQAVHNFLLNYMQRFEHLPFTAVPLRNGESPVYTVGLGLPVSVDVMGKVKVVRGKRQFTPSLLHQYDRSPSLFKNLSTVYSCSSEFLAYWNQ